MTLSLHDEVREAEAGRLRTLERENQELRGLLRVLQGQPRGQVSPAPYHPGRSFLASSSGSDRPSLVPSAPPAGGAE